MPFLLGHSRGKKRSPDWFRLGMALSLLAGVLGVVLLLIIVRAYRPERPPNDGRALRDATLTPAPTSPPDAAATPFSGGSAPANPTLVAPSATPGPWAVFLPVVAVARGGVAPAVSGSPTPTPPAPLSPRPR